MRHAKGGSVGFIKSRVVERDYDAIESELEELARSHVPWRRWTSREIELVRSYYRRVPTVRLCVLLGRSMMGLKMQVRVLRHSGVRFEYEKTEQERNKE